MLAGQAVRTKGLVGVSAGRGEPEKKIEKELDRIFMRGTIPTRMIGLVGLG